MLGRRGIRSGVARIGAWSRAPAAQDLAAFEDVVERLRAAVALAPAMSYAGSGIARMAENPTLPSSARFPSSISADKADRKGDEHPEWSDERNTVLPLVEAARAGDKEAFGQLYRRYHARVFGLARFYLADGAEDAVAETFVRAWSALPRYRTTSAPFVAWLYGIARHVVADEVKRRRRTEARERLPEDAVDPQHEERLALAAAIAKLPKQQRQIVEMKYLLGLKNPEVSRALKKTVGAINAQQWRALQSLKQSLEQE
jgi:RNA polymerase sigma-70 factor (ECF subfamily)